MPPKIRNFLRHYLMSLGPDPERPIDEKQLHERAIFLLRADVDQNEEYRRLLEMLSANPHTADTSAVLPSLPFTSRMRVGGRKT